MITHISIKDFAIIKELNVDLHPGLNIITGETGAGKSIIIEAVSMALGSRADTDYIRTDSDKAVVTILVDTSDMDVDELLDEMGAPKDNPLVLMREISSKSKSLCRVNGTIVPLSSLNRLCKKVADIHGQYDHQSLLSQENHLGILDLYGQGDVAAVKAMTGDFYRSLTDVTESLDELQRQLADSKRQKELMSYELNEIRAFALMPGEDEALEAEVRLMQNSEQIFTAVSSVYDALYEGQLPVYDGLGRAMRDLQAVSEYSKDIEEYATALSDAYYQIDDINHGLRRFRDSINFSVDELNEKLTRLDGINNLKRKYGGSIESIFAYAKKAEAALDSIENADRNTEELQRKKSLYQEQYSAAASRLSTLRKQAADLLEREITRELTELNFHDAVFRVSLKPGSPSETGSDSVEFLISANKGEAPKPLAKIASGGELSRIMLAMKRIIGDLDRIPTMVFDEIDSGISGATAGVVGKKLISISKTHQIVCITHLPQIACCGDNHYRIQKISDEISTHTTVVPLNPDDRIEELARLLSGTSITNAAREGARELLRLAKAE